MIIRRIKSGMPGLDPLIGGGFVANSINLITGETGTGKTIFGCQFLWYGLQQGEPGVLITLEESPEDIREDVKQFGWDFERYEKKGLCKIIYHDPAQVSNVGSKIIDEINDIKAKRLVIDSTSVLSLNIENPAQIRRKLLNIVSSIKNNNDTTALLIAEIPEGEKTLSKFGVEEYVVDGIIVMNYIGIKGLSGRSLSIRKMRRTDHGKDDYSMDIGKNGIVVKKG